MSKSLADSVLNDLKDRVEWEKRQEIWAKMRHDGLRRANPPWQNAADLHFPLGDTFVERHKPFYVQQLRSSQQLAQFVPDHAAAAAFTNSAAGWFDYKLKCKSNFQTEILFEIDGMLELGKNLLKITWDVDEKRLDFEAIDPMYVIVPFGTEDLQEADRLCHVIQMTRGQYARTEGFDQAILDKICGGADQAGAGQGHTFTEDKYRRDGINSSDKKDIVIVWEVYERTKDGIKVSTFSPMAPDSPVKAEYTLPYKHKLIPFVAFQYEMKDRGWYDNRGLVELAAPFEASLCKDWNDQTDYKTLVNRPLFYTENPIPNVANIKFNPGLILPFKVQSVPLQAPPISFDTSINFTRSVAEYRVAMPDYGIGNAQTTNDARTATEVAAIGAVSSQNVDLRAYVFRLSLGAVYVQAWELLKQYDAESLMYLVGKELASLSAEALQAVMHIEPSGTNDGSTKEKKIQKAWGRYQLFKDSPYVNQGELVKSILEADDEGLVNRLYQDPNEHAQDEYEDEAVMLPSIMQGAPIQPRPEQDQNARLQSIVDFTKFQMARGIQPDPVAMAGISKRVQGHLQVLGKKNPLQAKQWEHTIASMLQTPQSPQVMPQPTEKAA